MPKVKSNEREFQSQVISWLNKFIGQGGYPFELASGEVSISGEGNTRFPDVQLWINREAGEGFCGWELKPPDIPADNEVLLDNALEKASRMHARYFVTWNMRDAIIWEVLGDGEKKKYQRIFSYPPLAISSVEDLKVETNRIFLESEARQILDDIARLCREGHLTFIGTDDWFFIHRLTDTAHAIQPFYKKRLIKLVGESAGFKNRLFAWAATQGFTVGDAEEFYDKIAYQIVYQLLGRLLFFEVLQQFQSSISPMNIHGLDEKAANKELAARFAEIRTIDYQAIFEEDLPDEVPVPIDALPAVANLIDDFNKRDFAHLPQEVLGNVFENLIPPEERHRLGQYFTREDLVDFIVAFCVRGADSRILDPTCGTGTFLIRAYNKLKWQFAVRDHQKLLSQIWGTDIAPFPAELATINLYRQEIQNIGNFPRILKKDFFLIQNGQEYEFPPNKPFTDDPTRKIKEKLPLFDAIVGNPPYIRQEDIDKAAQNYSENIIRPALISDKRLLAPDASRIGQQFDPIELSGQADIYASMFVHAAALLNKRGRLGFVTSNSWLGAEYGKELRDFFLRHFKITAIVESRVEPWFETAQVNTVFTILERCDEKEERENNLAKFVSIKKKLTELIPWDMQTDASDRWHNLEVLTRRIEGVGDKFVRIKRSGAVAVELPKLVNDFEDENFRIRVIRQEAVQNEVSAKFGEGHWGRFLRAPGAYFELRDILHDKFSKLNDENIAEIRRGITGGITDFFTIAGDRIREFGIEGEFTAPFITSLREIEMPTVDPADASKLFLCHLDKNELRRLGKGGALKYIEWGENQKTTGRGAVGRAGVPWPDVPSVKNRKLWYDVGTREPGDVLINRFIGERIFFPLNTRKLFISDTFFEVKFKDEKLRDLWTALMNSAIFYLFVYVHGRVDWSQGPLRIYGPEIESLLLPDARKITPENKEKILKAFAPVLARPIKKIGDEVKEKDRRKFDTAVLVALGLDPEKYLDAIYDGLVGLVQTRLHLGKMQTIEKKYKKTKDVPRIKEEVLRAVLPDGLKPFPEAFLAPRAKCQEIAIPTGKLHFGNQFLGKQEVINERGEKYEATSGYEAAYIIFAQKPNSHIIKIPESSFEIRMAVVRYKKFLREIREKLAREFVMRTGDERMSEQLTAEVMEELNVL